MSSERAGSLTAYFFQAFYCTCSSGGLNLRSRQAAGGADTDHRPRCPDCGLKLPDEKDKKQASLTAFLFQDLRCRCASKSNSHESMSRLFYQLKQSGAGTTFNQMAERGEKPKKPSVDLMHGALIGGTYRIIRLIGAGGMGEVYQAQHMTLNKTCALKVIPPEQVTAIAWQRFKVEGRAVANLDHPNLVRVTDLGIHEGCLPFIAMDFVEGENLGYAIRMRGSLSLSRTIQIFLQICDGLSYAHRNGIIHRDLKPDNIMLEHAPGGKSVVKILDFGLAKLTHRDREGQSLTAVGDIFGSPFYMSPEQCAGGKIDARTDIYSAGCMLFECLTGRPPFVEKTAVAIMADHQYKDPPTLEQTLGKGVLPQSIDLLVAKMLRKNPTERYQSFAELAEDLGKVSRGEEVLPFYASRTRKAPATAELPREDKRKKSMLPAIAVIILLCGGAGAGGWLYILQKKEAPKQVATPAKVSTTGITVSDVKAIDDIDYYYTMHDSLNAGNAAPTTKRNAAGPPFCKRVMRNGAPYKEFRFPEDFSIGRITFNRQTERFAQGYVSTPASTYIKFSPTNAVLTQPEFMDRFQPGDIDEVQAYFLPDEFRFQFVRACQHMKGLTKLDLLPCSDLPARCVRDVGGYPALESLQIVLNKANIGAFSELPILPRLKKLSIYGDGDLRPALAKLSKSSALNELTFHGFDADEENFSEIAKCPNLQVLVLCAGAYDAIKTTRILKILAASPKLQKLAFESGVISAEGAEQLHSFKALKELLVDKPGEGVARRQSLSKLLPGLVVGPAVFE